MRVLKYYVDHTADKGTGLESEMGDATEVRGA